MKYLYFFLSFSADLGENLSPIGSPALVEVWVEAETKEIRVGIMFPGSVKLLLEAQPQAESDGCLQMSFRDFKIFFKKVFYYFSQVACRPWCNTSDNMNSTR